MCASFAFGRTLGSATAVTQWCGRGRWAGYSQSPVSATPQHVHGASPLMHTLVQRSKHHLLNRHRSLFIPVSSRSATAESVHDSRLRLQCSYSLHTRRTREVDMRLCFARRQQCRRLSLVGCSCRQCCASREGDHYPLANKESKCSIDFGFHVRQPNKRVLEAAGSAP